MLDVDTIALDATREILVALKNRYRGGRTQQLAHIQVLIIEAIEKALNEQRTQG